LGVIVSQYSKHSVLRKSQRFYTAASGWNPTAAPTIAMSKFATKANSLVPLRFECVTNRQCLQTNMSQSFSANWSCSADGGEKGLTGHSEPFSVRDATMAFSEDVTPQRMLSCPSPQRLKASCSDFLHPAPVFGQSSCLMNASHWHALRLLLPPLSAALSEMQTLPQRQRKCLPFCRGHRVGSAGQPGDQKSETLCDPKRGTEGRTEELGEARALPAKKLLSESGVDVGDEPVVADARE
jgi:hypothetical protein